jgi:tetratricopeptide (TPR) repeat protein
MKKTTVFSLLAIFLFSLVSLGVDETLFQKAGELLTKGKFVEAVKAYADFAKQNKDDRLAPVAWFNAGNIQNDYLNDISSAESSYEKALKANPEGNLQAEIYRRLADIEMREGDFKEALGFYQGGLKFSQGADYRKPDSWIASVADSCRSALSKIADPAFTVKIYAEIVNMVPAGEKNAETRYNYAQALKQTGQESEAGKVLAEMILAYPVSRSTTQCAQTEKEFLDQYAVIPWDILAEAGKLPGLFQQRKYEEGREIIKSLLARTDNPKLRESLNFSLIVSDAYISGDFESGLSRLQDFVEDHPQSERVTEAKQTLEFFAQVLSIRDRLKENPQDYSAHQELGYLFLQRRVDVLAEQEFLQAVQDTTLLDAYLGLGYVYLRTNRPELATPNLEKYLAQNPDDGDTYNRAGYAYLQMNRMEDALRCFKRYKEIEPDNPNAYDSYAECLMNMGKYEEAIAEYEKSLQIDPTWTNALFMLGEIYRNQGLKDKAIDYYQQYLAQDPTGLNSETARGNLTELKK